MSLADSTFKGRAGGAEPRSPTAQELDDHRYPPPQRPDQPANCVDPARPAEPAESPSVPALPCTERDHPAPLLHRRRRSALDQNRQFNRHKEKAPGVSPRGLLSRRTSSGSRLAAQRVRGSRLLHAHAAHVAHAARSRVHVVRLVLRRFRDHHFRRQQQACRRPSRTRSWPPVSTRAVSPSLTC